MKKHNYRSFNDAAHAAVALLATEASNSLSDPNKFDPIETYISRWVTSLQSGEYDESDMELATMVISRAGIESVKWLEENAGPFSVDDMTAIICRKQHDYGHKNITNFGVIGVGIRICDKIARIKNLSKLGDPKNESLLDSYYDIIGYSAIALMLENESFHLPLKDK